MDLLKKYLISLECQSALEQMAIPPNSVDLIITSPPYNVGKPYVASNDNLPYEQYMNFSKTWLINCFLWAKPSGRLCLNVPLEVHKTHRSMGADMTWIAKQVGWQYRTTIVWSKITDRKKSWGSWLSASSPAVIAPVELILVFYKTQWKKLHKGQSDIEKQHFLQWTEGLWCFNGERSSLLNHPAPFPRELPKRCIKLFSYVEDTVLDPFLGSGTTLIEALANRRYGMGLDIAKPYIQQSKARLMKVLNTPVNTSARAK